MNGPAEIAANRVAILHGVNLNMLGRRDSEHYGDMDLTALGREVGGFARELGLEVSFFQTNHEGEYCELLHRATEIADGLVLNPGAWSHYSYAIRDALEVAGVPAVEVHLSKVSQREDWRRTSVIRELCLASIEGEGVAGYRRALELLRERLGAG